MTFSYARKVLGTGASTGVPVIVCSCAVCSSTSSYNKRLRPAGLVHIGQKSLLIDVGPDYRQQALKYKINRLDGVLLTHTHYDHISGIDELRTYYLTQNKAMPFLLSNESFIDIDPLYRSANSSPHFEYYPEFVLR